MAMKDLSTDAEALMHYLKSERERGRITPANPITGRQLATKFGTTEREIQAQIEELTDNGYPIGIADNGKGYMWALSMPELERRIAGYRGRGEKFYTKARVLESIYPPEGQLNLAV